MIETELHHIITEGRKELPRDTLIRLSLGELLGTLKVAVKLPGQNSLTLYRNLEIRNGTLVLPVKLAFLSYAKEDAAFLRDLAGRLRQDGILTWFDEKDILPGDDWKRRIDETMERSDYVLVFLSSRSVSKTGYFQRELKYALGQRQLRPEGTRYIIPILLDECKIPRLLQDIQWVHVSEADWYTRLRRALLPSFALGVGP